MPWTRSGKRKQALAEPFPDSWRRLLAAKMAMWNQFTTQEQESLEDIIRLMRVDLEWEHPPTFELTDDMKVVIAANAGVLLLGLDYDYFHRVTTVIVVPDAVVHRGYHPVGNGIYTERDVVLAGETDQHGPILLTWRDVSDDSAHPDRGRNVVYHEFAHAIDMLDGGADGTPPFETDEEIEEWKEVATREFDVIRAGGDSLLDPYAGEDPAEFFAVATETFFTLPRRLRSEKPDLYRLLAGFYQQDPAEREENGAGRFR